MHNRPSEVFELRPFQKEALKTLHQPGHIICISPTGSGKSLIYENYSQKHRTLLVTPLIALARQQHARLMSLGIPVTLAAGPDPEPPPASKTGVWIISPERLAHAGSAQKAAAWKPDLLAVDECHCLWDWGEKFRPSFLLIPDFLNKHSIKRSIWLSATLPKAARDELARELPSPLTEIGEFALPPTLHLSIEKTSWPNRANRLLEFVLSRTDAGIVFVQTRANAQRLTHLLQAAGKRCALYHAGMASEERRIIERKIEDRDPEIIIATSAFGMGMDHPHLRWAVLWQAPPSLLALAQSIGRAGRHRLMKSHALILWDDEDFRLIEWVTHGSRRRLQELQDVRHFLAQTACRRAALADYFSSRAALAHCNQCDFCDGH